MCKVGQSMSLRVDLPSQARQQTADAAQFLAFPEKTIPENPVFDLVYDFTLSGGDGRENICHILDEPDHETHCGCEGYAAANFQTQSVHGLERMQTRGHDNIFIHVESQHSKAIRIGVELEMQIAEHYREEVRALALGSVRKRRSTFGPGHLRG
jgi:hypothetical protein